MEKATLAAMLGAMMLMTAPATAQTRMSMPSFEELDTDSSGSLTQEDLQAGMQQQREAMQDQMIASIMQHADENGMLDEAGLRAGLADLRPEPRSDRRADMASRMFSRIDRNDDGVIDAEEYERFTEMMGKRGQRGQHGRPRMRGQN